jgi:hypothetical protein
MTSGTITNNAGGTISGNQGVFAFSNTSIFNSGTITGTGGTAITFFGGGNTLTLAPGSVINGTAHGFGADTFQLGGTGADSFTDPPATLMPSPPKAPWIRPELVILAVALP